MAEYNLMLITPKNKQMSLGVIQDESLPRLYDVMTIDRLSLHVLQALFPKLDEEIVKEKKHLKFGVTSIERSLVNLHTDNINLFPKTPTVYISLIE